MFNLMATGLLLPLVLMDSLMDYSPTSLEHGLCLACQSVSTLVTSGSVGAALVIAVDQYCAVMAPLHYHRRITKVRAWLLLAGQWIYALTMAALSLSDSAGRRFWKSCNAAAVTANAANAAPATVADLTTTDDVQLTTQNDLNISMTTEAAAAAAAAADPTAYDIYSVFFVILSSVCYVVPLVLLTCMYMRIYSAAHRNSQRTRRTSLTHSASELVVHCLGASQNVLSGSMMRIERDSSTSTVCSLVGGAVGAESNGATMGQSLVYPAAAAASLNPPSRTPSLRSTSSQIVHNLRHRISNASVYLYREEARAARVSVLVLVLVVFCWSPYHALLASQAWPPSVAPHLPAYAYHLALVAVLLNSLSSPFLYAYRSRRIQREVRRLFGLPLKSRKEQTVTSSSASSRAKRLVAGPCHYHYQQHSKSKTKSSARSLSPRRQLLCKQAATMTTTTMTTAAVAAAAAAQAQVVVVVRGASADALSPDEMQATLGNVNGSASGSNTVTATEELPQELLEQQQQQHVPSRTFWLMKMTRLWQHKPASGPQRRMASGAPGSSRQLIAAVPADVSRSSFSSATSNSSSADSDVSL